MNDPAIRATAPAYHPVIVVGGGQSGLSISYCLKQRGIDHLVFERHRVAHAWRAQRWNSFCLVTPNWQCKLPGFPYAGTDPHGFMLKDQIVEYVEAYAKSFAPPLVEGVAVTSVRRAPSGLFQVTAATGEYTADQVVIAAGGYHLPTVPRMAERLPGEIVQLHSADYRDAESLPEGEVLVVGSGQSGCQIAEDLHLAGRRVHLSVGSAPRSPRRYRGKDVVDWLDEMGYYDMPIHEHPLKERVRNKANHYLTGRDGGREIDLRKLAREGMRLYGRLEDVRGGVLEFATDLKHNLDQADAVAESIKTTIDKHIEKQGIDAPPREAYKPVWQPEREELAFDCAEAGIRVVIWCIGFRTDFSWIEVPVFDGRGYPGHRRGVTAAPGLYFLGLPWLYTWGSGRFSGVARDAEHVAECIESLQKSPQLRSHQVLNELALGS